MVHYQDLKGQRAPPLSLVDHNGQPFEFKPLEGALRTILFFMSGFNTSSLKQVTLVQDLIEEREAAGKAKMQVLGVLNCARNPSKLADLAHGRGLTYTLLNDPMGVARNAYGAVGERRLTQIVKKTFRLAPELWVDHVTFVIDERGVVRDAFSSSNNTNIPGHIQFLRHVLDRLDADDSSPSAQLPANGS